ncbi:hypothetical protein MTR67_034196 [Solanum verrucosum]|uniref:Retrotransposon gag domain-containing protein n=1 Tax=Solanum verrucosum TaxID=315347 RepID=A0AAF0U7Z5_SOLVR|nr:hypothetical protein MTR67_034196 [Solanum verrucosum]
MLLDYSILEGTRRSGSPATTSVDPTKSLNLAAARSLISDSPATRSIAVRGRPARRNVEDQGVPNAPEVQPQGEVTNAEFSEAIRMLSQVVTNQVGQQRENRQEVVDTSRICEFLRMNPSSFTGSSVTEDLKNFVEELQKVFEVMHVSDVERVELAAYQLKSVARIWFDHWKKGRVEGAPIVSWVVFESAFIGSFFPRELREVKVREFLTIKKESMSVHEYSLKFTNFPVMLRMVANMRSMMSLFVVGLSRLSSMISEGSHMPFFNMEL